MQLTTKLSTFVTLFIGLTIFVALAGCSLSFCDAIQYKLTTRVRAVTTAIGTHLASRDAAALTPQIDGLMISVDIVRIGLLQDENVVYDHSRISSYRPTGTSNLYREITVSLVKHPDMPLHLVHQGPMGNYFHSLPTITPLTITTTFIILMLFLFVHWLQRQLSGQELLEIYSTRILSGERGPDVWGTVYEWLACTSSTPDMLLIEIQNAHGQRSRLDTLIRFYVAQDTKTELSSRLFFDSQLATLLEDREKVGSHGVVMMMRLSDFTLLRNNQGVVLVEEQISVLINLLSTFMTCYPGALPVRYHRSSFATLLPHRMLEEAESIARQLPKATDALPANKMIDRADMAHIGACVCRSGQSPEQVVDHTEAAARNSALQRGNSWLVYDDSLPEKGRGNVRRRTLIERMFSRDGPRIYQKPAVTCEGQAHHQELMCHTSDGSEEIVLAGYMPVVLQFGLAEGYDRLQISRLVLPLDY